jgi:hypothetical protein
MKVAISYILRERMKVIIIETWVNMLGKASYVNEFFVIVPF